MGIILVKAEKCQIYQQNGVRPSDTVSVISSLGLLGQYYKTFLKLQCSHLCGFVIVRAFSLVYYLLVRLGATLMGLHSGLAIKN